MKDKLRKTKRRINWYRVIAEVPALNREFVLWCGDKNRKIRSIRRLAYLFLKSKYGNNWISEARDNYYTDDELVRILRTPWISRGV